MDEPLDLRTPEEKRRDAELGALALLCESNRILWAFRERGLTNPSSLDEIAALLELPDSPTANQFLQKRFDYFVAMGHMSEPTSGRYKINPQRWQSKLRGT